MWCRCLNVTTYILVFPSVNDFGFDSAVSAVRIPLCLYFISCDIPVKQEIHKRVIEKRKLVSFVLPVWNIRRTDVFLCMYARI